MKRLLEKVSLKSFIFLILAILVTQIPVLGKYVGVINTLIHETGHALIALLGGDVERISLFMNTEGVTYSMQSTWIGSFFTSLAGYVFSSFMAFLFLWLIGRRQYKLLTTIILSLLLLNLVFWVRNPYGIFWLSSFGAAFVLLLLKGSTKLINGVMLLFASILLVDSLTSASEIMLISLMTPWVAGDATNLARLTGVIPAQVWGIFFLLQAIWFSLIGIKKGIFKVRD